MKEDLKREQQKQSQKEIDPQTEELTMAVAQLKCDKESAYKRFKYVETKLQNA